MAVSQPYKNRQRPPDEPCGPAQEVDLLHQYAPDLTAIIPVEDRGRHELLRVAASLAQQIPDSYAQTIAIAAQALRIQPAAVDEVITQITDQGILARFEGRLVALGRVEFLGRIGALPHLAELHAAETIEDLESIPYFIVIVAERRCLGLLGIKN
jgi:cation transport ATPase